MKKIVVIYYSWSNGNTKRIAEQLSRETGADLVRIDTVKPYEGSHDDVVAQGHREVNEGYKPQIKPVDVDLSQYDIIAVGTPTWWYTMAPAIHTFLDQTDFTGKTVIPFMTNGGWPGHVIKDMKKECRALLSPVRWKYSLIPQAATIWKLPRRRLKEIMCINM